MTEVYVGKTSKSVQDWVADNWRVASTVFDYGSSKEIVKIDGWLEYKDISRHGSLKRVTIGSKVYAISQEAFKGCTALQKVSIPDNVVKLLRGAFSDCYPGLSEVYIGKGVTSVEEAVFSGSHGINKIEVSEDNPKYDSRQSCNAVVETSTGTIVAGCWKTRFNATGLKQIGSYAFSHINGIGDVDLSQLNYTQIGPKSFLGCEGLDSFKTSEMTTYIGESAFDGCVNLNSVTLGSQITKVGSNAFAGCPNLTVYVPNDTIYDLVQNSGFTGRIVVQ